MSGKAQRTESTFTYFLDDNNSFEIFSDGISDFKLSNSNGALSFDNSGDSGSYQTIASNIVVKAEITMPVGHPVGVNAVVVGVLEDGNYAILYLDGGGEVRKFWKDGHVDTDLLYTMPSNRPTVAKGETYTIEKKSDRFTLTYTNYTQDILFSSITDFNYAVIGVLGTGSDTINYTYTILL